MTDQATLHPRLLARREAIGRMLGLDDATELAAALGDIQTLLYRCGYHVAFTSEERATHLKRRRRSGCTGRARRGRRPGSANWASRQLGLGLATIWFELSGAAPARRFDGYGDRGEHGPYREFVACIWEALPERVRPKRKGHVPAVDHFVRTSIEAFHEAQASADESQRRGLLPEATWNRE